MLRLDGSQWQQVAGPRPHAGVPAPLASITVTSAANAWAVGHTAGKILILHWNGTNWVTVPAPSPAGTKPASWPGVSAVSSSAAWAVGEADFPPMSASS